MVSPDDRILELLATHAKVETVQPTDKLFSGGINLSSVSYTEFVLEFEDTFDVEVDMESLDGSVETVAQFIDVLKTYL